jgi:hypothetical protein
MHPTLIILKMLAVAYAFAVWRELIPCGGWHIAAPWAFISVICPEARCLCLAVAGSLADLLVQWRAKPDDRPDPERLEVAETGARLEPPNAACCLLDGAGVLAPRPPLDSAGSSV